MKTTSVGYAVCDDSGPNPVYVAESHQMALQSALDGGIASQSNVKGDKRIRLHAGYKIRRVRIIISPRLRNTEAKKRA